MAMLLERGYNDLGIASLLAATDTPKGSFYYHFKDKEDFALQAIGQYMGQVHEALDQCLADENFPPLLRVRRFFETVQESYRQEGYLGCLLGGLGQELAGISVVFRSKIDDCLSQIAERIGGCLRIALDAGDLPAGSDPDHLAGLLVDCWEGAALRSRLRGDSSSLTAMLDFYFRSAVVPV